MVVEKVKYVFEGDRGDGGGWNGKWYKYIIINENQVCCRYSLFPHIMSYIFDER